MKSKALQIRRKKFKISPREDYTGKVNPRRVALERKMNS